MARRQRRASEELLLLLALVLAAGITLAFAVVGSSAVVVLATASGPTPTMVPPSASPTVTAVVLVTPTPRATNTATPGARPSPTVTPTRTATSTPTLTATPTLTLTPTRTPGDTTPPHTTARLSPPPNQAGWNNTAVSLSLYASDQSSAIARVYFAVDNPACTPAGTRNCLLYAGTPFAVRTDGQHDITFFAIDRAGNMEQLQHVALRIDSVPPETRIMVDPQRTDNRRAGTSTWTFPANAFQSNEPDAAFECSAWGAQFAACPSPRSWTAAYGTNLDLQVRARDRAGNVDPTPALKVEIP